MTFTLSPPIRYAALLGLVASVFIGGTLMVLGRSHSSTAPVPHTIKHHPFGLGLGVKAKQSTPGKGSATKGRTPAPTAPVKAPETPSPVLAALAAGLPGPVATALGGHSTVVVGLYNPYSRVDGISFAEAKAGAHMAGVGFVPLNVLSKAQVQGLTEMLGLLPDPGVLIYVRPGTLVARISGFADKETVAQAAQNAARGT